MLESFELTYDVNIADATGIVVNAWCQGWTIPPKQTVSEWADNYPRKIGKGAGAEPGDWKTSRNPILREIQDSLSEHVRVRLVDFMKSAQIGATEVGINWTCSVVERGLDSMIVAQPVKDLSRSWATAKFDPAIALMPKLQALLSTDNTLEKRFPGGTLWVIWTNSSKQLRQRTARYIFMDEVEEYPDDLADQGPADEQLAARAMSYGDRAKIYRASTPAVAGASKIAKGFNAGDRRYYVVRCPHCYVHQALHRDQLMVNGTFACTANGCVIEERHKAAMLVERTACATCGEVPVRMIIGLVGERHRFADDCACGRVEDPPEPDGAYWGPTNPAAPPWHRSYHAWAAYMPDGLGLTWQEIADAKAEAERDPSKLQAFINLKCGEPYEGERKEQDAEEIATLAEPGIYLGKVPAGAYVLTIGVDCQHDRFEAQVVAWGRGQRGRVVAYVTLDGDPSKPDGFAELDAFLQELWTNVDGKQLHAQVVAIDGGNWTEMVAQFVKKCVGTSGSHRLLKIGDGYRKQHIYLVRGRSEHKSERAVYRPAKTEVNQREKTVARSVGMWGVGTSVIKHLVFGWLQSALVARADANKHGEAESIDARMLRFPGGRGVKHDPANPDPGALAPLYYEGLASEYYDEAAKRWVKRAGVRNEPLDTLVYAYWGALSPALKVDAMRDSQWLAIEKALAPDPADLFNAPASRGTSAPTSSAPAAATKQPAAAPAARPSSWGDDDDSERGWGT